MRIELRISDVGITLDTAQRVWEAARELLRRDGMTLTHPRLLRDLAGHKGLDIAGDCVRVSPALFESRYPSPMTRRGLRRGPPPAGDSKAPTSARLTIGGGGYSMDVVDWRTGELRPATVRDLAESCRVVEACGSSGPYCVTPQDVAPLLQDVVTYKTCFEHSAGNVRGAYYSSPRQSPFIEQMCEVMGEPFRLLLGVVSPLKVSNMDLDNIYRAASRKKRYPIVLVGYGVPGIGSPAGLAASAALVMAENYGTAILVSAAFPENEVKAGVNPGGATDFRHCNYAYGAPHTFVYNVVNAYLSAALAGIDPTGPLTFAGGALDGVDPTEEMSLGSVALYTGACVPDEQAGTEKSAAAMIGALLGARHFACAGNLCVDDVFSLEQFLIDREIAEHAVRTVECCAPSELMAETGSFLEEMGGVLSGQDFLALPSTLRVMRAFYRPSAVFEHMKLRAWQGGGARTVRDKVRREIERKLAGSDFEPAAEKKRELDRIYAAAERELI